MVNIYSDPYTTSMQAELRVCVCVCVSVSVSVKRVRPLTCHGFGDVPKFQAPHDFKPVSHVRPSAEHFVALAASRDV